MRHSQRFIGSLSALILVAILIMGFSPPQVLAQDGGIIGVENDGPSFISIVIEEDDNYKYVDVQVRDLNGWSDIFSVNVTIMGNVGDILSQVSYTQYLNLASTVPTITWTEMAGHHFVESASGFALQEVAPWTSTSGYAAMEIGLRVIFAFDKFSGDTVNILVMDKGLLMCESDTPFSAEYTPAPKWRNVAVPISLSSLVAAGVAGFLVYRRFKNNKLARSVEASHAGK